MLLNDKEKRAIECAENLIDLCRYTYPMKFGDEELEIVKSLLNIIDRQQEVIEKLKIKECGDKEWQHCRVEKMRL